MAKIKYKYICSECDHESSLKFTLCPKCKEGFGQPVENMDNENNVTVMSKGKMTNKEVIITNSPIDINEVDLSNIKHNRINTGYSTMDELFGDGIMPASFTLISGEPGIGKSTLLLKIIDSIENNTDLKCLMVSAEESKEQIKARKDRMNAVGNWKILNETLLENIIKIAIDYDFIIIDSINTIYNENGGTMGGVSQIRDCAATLMNFAKQNHKTIIVIGHVTKDGELAGPKVLEHIVDTVLFFDNYDNDNLYRFVSSSKNRFGKVNEMAIFKMTGTGLEEILNPSLMFIDKESQKIGSALSLIIDSNKPIFVEIQALLVKTKAEKTFTQSIGIDQKRIYQISAILQKYLKLWLFDSNMFINISGGLRITSTHIDLAIIGAICSSLTDTTNNQTVFIGEVGLSGEIKKVPNEEELIKAAIKYGFKNVISNSTGFKNVSDLNQLFSFKKNEKDKEE